MRPLDANSSAWWGWLVKETPEPPLTYVLLPLQLRVPERHGQWPLLKTCMLLFQDVRNQNEARSELTRFKTSQTAGHRCLWCVTVIQCSEDSHVCLYCPFQGSWSIGKRAWEGTQELEEELEWCGEVASSGPAS